jgi:hypothetical protein
MLVRGDVIGTDITILSFGPDVKFTGFVRFHFLTAANMKIRAFWDIAPCSLFEVDRRFRGSLRPSSGSSSVYSNETTRRCTPDGSNLQLIGLLATHKRSVPAVYFGKYRFHQVARTEVEDRITHR